MIQPSGIAAWDMAASLNEFVKWGSRAGAGRSDGIVEVFFQPVGGDFSSRPIAKLIHAASHRLQRRRLCMTQKNGAGLHARFYGRALFANGPDEVPFRNRGR